jgi:hypothetical protein
MIDGNFFTDEMAPSRHMYLGAFRGLMKQGLHLMAKSEVCVVAV